MYSDSTLSFMHYQSPLGPIILIGNEAALTGLWFETSRYLPAYSLMEENPVLPVFNETVRWLDVYFSGSTPDFTPPLSFHDTPFRETVWKTLLTIPYGNTMTYGQLAHIVAKKDGRSSMSAQAVGSAVGHNPISIIVPCHRVIGAQGNLTGYAAGLNKKEELLKLEGILLV